MCPAQDGLRKLEKAIPMLHRNGIQAARHKLPERQRQCAESAPVIHEGWIPPVSQKQFIAAIAAQADGDLGSRQPGYQEGRYLGGTADGFGLDCRRFRHNDQCTVPGYVQFGMIGS